MAFTKLSNPDAVIYKLLKQLSLNFDLDTIRLELEKHPDYPGLISVSDVLNSFNVENSAYQVAIDQLNQVPCPFIAVTTINNGDFVVVNKIDNDAVIVSSNNWNNHKLSLDYFKTIFAEVVLKAEPNLTGSALQMHKLPTRSRLTDLKSFIGVVGLTLILLFLVVFYTDYFTTINWRTICLTAAKAAGLLASMVLFWQSFFGDNSLFQKLCQSGGKTNCNAILSSKAANVFKGLTWSEVGLFYFSGTWLLLLFGSGSQTIWQILLVLNIISLPYTFFSIYYQAIVAKQYCILCCTIQAILWVEFFALIKPNSPFLKLPNLKEAGLTLASLALPILLWLLLKPLFLKVQQLYPLKKQLRKIKYDKKLFQNILTKQPEHVQPDDDWSISLGNNNAHNVITMITNPYCPPCAKAHHQLEEWLSCTKNLKVNVIFTANNNEEDIKTPISRHLMALNDLPDKNIVKQAMHDWFNQKQKNYEAWAKIYPVDLMESKYYKVDNQFSWCKTAGITVTPTFLVNGYRLPDLYNVPDLKYMLD